MSEQKISTTMVGWREWVALPDLGVSAIKAKIDTGARTSALHVVSPRRFTRDGGPWVRFGLPTEQGQDDPMINAEAPVLDERWVSDSGGHREKRLVITTRLVVAGIGSPIELTLTSRDKMRFRLLIGRTALRHRLTVDPGSSFLTGTRTDRKDSPQ